MVTTMTDTKNRSGTDPESMQVIIRELLDEAGPGRSISATDVARRAGGDPNRTSDWRPLLRAVGRAATMMQDAGTLVALRKGKQVDIRGAKGIIRLAAVAAAAAKSEDA